MNRLHAQILDKIDSLLSPSAGLIDAEKQLIEIHDDLLTISATMLENFTPKISGQGICIAPADAAHCLKSVHRTIAYWQALRASLEQQSHKKDIRIIYPGCGPFASLVLPLLTGYLNIGVKVYFIDYHAPALTHLKNLIDYFGAHDLVADIICAEATEWQPTSTVDIVILECMLNGLEREGQVALTNHFSPFLTQGGQLIPDHIDITANWIHATEELNYIQQKLSYRQKIDIEKLANFRHPIGEIFRLSRHSHLGFNDDKKIINAKTIIIDDIPDRHYHFALCTQLSFTHRIHLREYDDGITYPYYPNVDIHRRRGNKIDINYRLGKHPGFSFDNTLY